MKTTIESGDRGLLLVYRDTYATTPEDLWAAITTPQRLARWMADARGSFALGGQWELFENNERWALGTATECEAPRRIVTTWHAIGEDPTELEITLEATAGGTDLVLRHTGVQSIFYAAGWEAYLGMLAAHLAQPETQLAGTDEWQTRFDAVAPQIQAAYGHLRD